MCPKLFTGAYLYVINKSKQVTTNGLQYRNCQKFTNLASIQHFLFNKTINTIISPFCGWHKSVLRFSLLALACLQIEENYRNAKMQCNEYWRIQDISKIVFP